jgi:hypothetical protein
MGRLTSEERKARIDPLLCVRITPQARASRCRLDLHEVAVAAFDAGRSCYFRPLFDRPRQWAEQRSPRSAASGHNSTDR